MLLMNDACAIIIYLNCWFWNWVRFVYICAVILLLVYMCWFQVSPLLSPLEFEHITYEANSFVRLYRGIVTDPVDTRIIAVSTYRPVVHSSLLGNY